MMNHPPFSMDQAHSGSLRMGRLLEEGIKYADRQPDVVFSADVFNYQRFTRSSDGRDSVYVIPGVGGYPNLRGMPHLSLPLRVPDVEGLSVESYYVQHGFVKVMVSKTQLLIQYFSVAKANSGSQVELRDFATLDLQSHRIIGTGKS